MQTYDILYESSPWHKRVALFDDRERLVTLRVDDPSRRFLEGTVVQGRVRKIVKALDAAFVDIGDAVDGLLPLDKLEEGVKRPSEGEAITVRVARARRDDKGALLDGRTALRVEPGAEVPSIVFPAPGALSRALMDAGDHPVRVWIVDGRFEEEVAQIVQRDRIFRLDQEPDKHLTAQLDHQLDSLADTTWDLPCAGRLTVERTKALTAFDVDVAGATGVRGRASRDEIVDMVNKEAVVEVMRLCRLLDIGGSVIVDFVTMPKKQRKPLQDYVRNLFMQNDSHKVEVLDISRFGLMELNRQRHGEGLDILMRSPVYVAGRICLELFRRTSVPKKGYKIRANPAVLDILRQRFTTAAAMAYFGCEVSSDEDASLNIWQFKVI